jgi:hypothetical protein
MAWPALLDLARGPSERLPESPAATGSAAPGARSGRCPIQSSPLRSVLSWRPARSMAKATGWNAEGPAAMFPAVNHHRAECVGLHADRHGTRSEALEPLR